MSSPVRNIHKLKKKTHKTPVFDNHTCKQSKYHTFISYQQFTSIEQVINTNKTKFKLLIIFTVLTDLLSSVVETFNMISINVFHPAYILPILYISKFPFYKFTISYFRYQFSRE